MEVRGIEPLTS